MAATAFGDEDLFKREDIDDPHGSYQPDHVLPQPYEQETAPLDGPEDNQIVSE